MLFKYEVKKILWKKGARAALAVLALWMIGSLFFVVHSSSWVQEDGTELHGLQAVRRIREAKTQWNGTLTEERIAEVIRANRQIHDDYPDSEKDINESQTVYSKIQPFQDIRDIINSSFARFKDYDYYRADHLAESDASLFYLNRSQGIEEWLNEEIKMRPISDKAKAFYMDSARTLETPLEYKYMDGWNTALNYSSMVLFVNLIVICILLAPVFGIEYQTGADAVFLSSRYGRSKGIRAKLAGAFTVATAVYWISMLFFIGVIFIIYGTSGGMCPIQANEYCWKSFYHLTNVQALGIILGLGYLGCLVMSSITLFISARMKSAFAAIILAFVVLIVPQMMDVTSIPMLQKIFNLMPHQSIASYMLIRSYDVFQIGNRMITPPAMIAIIYLPVSLLILPFTYRSFKYHQVN